ncbi:PLP-dependent transferase [Granulicella tundricola]|uniref:Cys/Met metabolism pyridoxal-phosphate-dependent protein n=1 Tax=Granulicella tundricola (strain ATCC BAA-1859 / DSM 23138 / MP5ACTX9) TaxID=1198114 RepID=E8X6Y5_GRATM|nr:PLP-dependent transferase [Granulicella tundricola]ADW71094.1 Cys/Met metabolism pyridoxal-phosphate-dependent protein [Granulicella tundricola MP5ACTX9]
MSLLRTTRWSRREVLKQSGMISAVGAATSISPALAQSSPKAPTITHHGTSTDNLFTQIGVRPIVNGHGTFTIISGSRSLPEVKQAMYDASFYFVHLDELQDAVGKELGQLTGAEWGCATTGCEAAIALATVACIAGTDVEKSQALPYIKAKDQVIIPKHSRNPYDFGVRMTGAEVVEVDSPEELRAKISKRTAMIYILSGPAAEKGPMSIPSICAIAKEMGVPVFVDAAAEEPLNPNIHIQHGATLVGYSGGKCMRGPQSSGMLIGQKDLVRAAYFQAAPHHNYGRAYKCSKEEIMGLLAAVRQWYKRDHAAEQAEWVSWLQHIESRVKGLPSVTTEYLHPDDLSNNSQRLRINWDATQLKITGTEMIERLDAGTPRIMVDGGSGSRPDHMASSLTIMPYMMAAGEDKIIADAVYALLTNPGPYANPVVPSGAPAKVAGTWAVSIQYSRGEGEQHFTLTQSGNDLTGTQKGELYTTPLKGSIHGDQIALNSDMKVSGHSVGFNFKGIVQGSTISGTVNLGEYGTATWKAKQA